MPSSLRSSPSADCLVSATGAVNRTTRNLKILFIFRRLFVPIPDHSAIPCGVSDAREIRNLALVGFMGVGKSTVGRQLAEELGFTFVDTDEEIENRSGTSIAEIFARAGEERFRELERDLVEEMVGWSDVVIATGGGLVVQPGNLDRLKQHALVACLWAGPHTIHQRTAHQTHRPLLRTEDPEARIREMLAAREPFYKQADLLVSTELRPIREIVSNIAHQFRDARSKSGPSQ